MSGNPREYRRVEVPMQSGGCFYVDASGPPLRRSQSSPNVRFSAVSKPSVIRALSNSSTRKRRLPSARGKPAGVGGAIYPQSYPKIPKTERRAFRIIPRGTGWMCCGVKRRILFSPTPLHLPPCGACGIPLYHRALGRRLVLCLHCAVRLPISASDVNVKPAMGRVASGLGGLLESEGSRHG